MDISCVGAIIRDNDGRIVVIQRKNPPNEGLWSIPGGRVKDGETPEQALSREVFEETGLRIDVGDVAGSVVLEAVEPQDRYLVTDYFAAVTGGTSSVPEPGDDAGEARWVTFTEFVELELTPDLAATFEGWQVWASTPRSDA